MDLLYIQENNYRSDYGSRLDILRWYRNYRGRGLHTFDLRKLCFERIQSWQCIQVYTWVVCQWKFLDKYIHCDRSQLCKGCLDHMETANKDSNHLWLEQKWIYIIIEKVYNMKFVMIYHLVFEHHIYSMRCRWIQASSSKMENDWWLCIQHSHHTLLGMDLCTCCWSMLLIYRNRSLWRILVCIRYKDRRYIQVGIHTIRHHFFLYIQHLHHMAMGCMDFVEVL